MQDTGGESGTDAFNSPMQARTPGRDIFGELDDELPPIRVPAHVKVRARQRAHELGLDLTAFMRLNLYASLFSPEHVASLHKKQLDRVLGNAMPNAEGSSTAPGAELAGFLKVAAK